MNSHRHNCEAFFENVLNLFVEYIPVLDIRKRIEFPEIDGQREERLGLIHDQNSCLGLRIVENIHEEKKTIECLR